MTVSPRKLVRRHVQLPAPSPLGRSLAVEDRLPAARTARSERLTISRKHNKAQHTEKAAVFHYSKVKEGAFLRSR
jgi:hypothetical protein